MSNINEIIKNKNKDKIERLNKAVFHCPCCDFISLSKKNAFEICPICFWQDDTLDNEGYSGANGMKIQEARHNYKKYGACSEDIIKNVLPKLLIDKYGRR